MSLLRGKCMFVVAFVAVAGFVCASTSPASANEMDATEVERVSEIIANVDPEVEAENPNVQISGKTVSAGGVEAVIPHAESVAAVGGTCL